MSQHVLDSMETERSMEAHSLLETALNRCRWFHLWGFLRDPRAPPASVGGSRDRGWQAWPHRWWCFSIGNCHSATHDADRRSRPRAMGLDPRYKHWLWSDHWPQTVSCSGWPGSTVTHMGMFLTIFWTSLGSILIHILDTKRSKKDSRKDGFAGKVHQSSDQMISLGGEMQDPSTQETYKRTIEPTNKQKQPTNQPTKQLKRNTTKQTRQSKHNKQTKQTKSNKHKQTNRRFGFREMLSTMAAQQPDDWAKTKDTGRRHGGMPMTTFDACNLHIHESSPFILRYCLQNPRCPTYTFWNLCPFSASPNESHEQHTSKTGLTITFSI